MAFPQGLNFRTSGGYVTDGANYDFISAPWHATQGTYPFTTAQGNVVGWEGTNLNTTVDSGDRDAGTDPRLAGINQVVLTGSDVRFRIDLPSAGNYRIGIAAGDYSNAANVNWDLKDTTSLLAHLTTGTTVLSPGFKDATNAEYIATDWVLNQALVQYTFSTAILRLYPTTSSDLSTIASLWVEAVGGGGQTLHPMSLL